jgi:hypothetical protein
MLFLTSLESLNPDEIKQLKAWHGDHCAPGKRCDECGDVFGDPFTYERLVKSDIAPDAFLLYAVCEDCAERYASNPERGFPNCEAHAECIKDRIVVLPVVLPVVN